MGLDMYITKKTYVKNWDHMKPEERYEITVQKGGQDSSIKPNRISTIIEECGYFRKFNALHKWFVDNIQNGKDDCGEYYITEGKMKELHSTLSLVIAHRNNEYAEEYLPTASGFFFGDTDYDEYYWGDIARALDIIGECLNEGGDFYYSSSW